MGLDVTRDQADKRQFDGLALKNKTPGLRYRWGRRDDFQIALNRFNGYEVVDSNEDKVESILSSGSRMKKGQDIDGTITLGDLVLMSIPEDVYQQRRKQEEDLAIRRQLAITRGYHSEIARIAGQSGVSYEAGHFVGKGQAGVGEQQRAEAADRAGRRDKMKEAVGEDWDKEIRDIESLRGGGS